MTRSLTDKLNHINSQLELINDAIYNIMEYEECIQKEINNYLETLGSHHTKLTSYKEILHKAQSIISSDDSTSKKFWRDKVLMRDRFTCQKCGSREDLTCHHIMSQKQCTAFRWNVNNGITLCKSCHNEWNETHDHHSVSTRVFLKWLSKK